MPKRARYCYYLFINGNERVVERFHVGPAAKTDLSAEQWGKDNGFKASIGPFKTLRAAEYMREHGRNNPHLRTVADAERRCKLTGIDSGLI